MLDDKANRVRQSPPYYNSQSARSLRYFEREWECLFIKYCPNYLIKNIRTPDIGLASLSGVQSSPLRYLIIVESAIASGPRTAINYLWMIETDDPCLSRKRYIELWSIVHDVKSKRHDRSLRHWNACRLMSRKMSKQLIKWINYTLCGVSQIINIWGRPQLVMLHLRGISYNLSLLLFRKSRPFLRYTSKQERSSKPSNLFT
jgi:hypothetical protein